MIRYVGTSTDNECINGGSIPPIPTTPKEIEKGERMKTMDEAKAMINDLNAKYVSVVPAGHLGIRVIDMATMVISQDILVLDTPADREEMTMALVLLTMLPPNFLILTNLV